MSLKGATKIHWWTPIGLIPVGSVHRVVREATKGNMRAIWLLDSLRRKICRKMEAGMSYKVSTMKHRILTTKRQIKTYRLTMIFWSQTCKNQSSTCKNWSRSQTLTSDHTNKKLNSKFKPYKNFSSQKTIKSNNLIGKSLDSKKYHFRLHPTAESIWAMWNRIRLTW